jgi:bacillopeptidase F (M6 metalloprotease family)
VPASVAEKRSRIVLPATAHQKLQFRWTFAHDATARSVDELRVEVIDTATASATTVLLAQGAAVERNASWNTAKIDLTAWAGKTIRLRFSATDAGTNGIVEAGFDDVRVTQPQ